MRFWVHDPGRQHCPQQRTASDSKRSPLIAPPLKHIQRAKIMLYSAERLRVLEVTRRAGVSRPVVWRWQQRFSEEGADGLLHDKTRKPGHAPLSTKIVRRYFSLRAVQRIWEKHCLQPRRIRTIKRSNDKAIFDKLAASTELSV